jgi:ketosteroid isomerase-like protein
MTARETLLRDYFDAWRKRDGSRLGDFFAEDAVYTESDGSRYEGLPRIRRWFAEWNAQGEVTAWSISRFVHQGDTTAVQWFFSCRYQGKSYAFDGVTLADFNAEGKIVTLREYVAKLASDATKNDIC